jgi:hypothetical protein
MTTLYAEIGKSLNIKRKGEETLLDFSKRAASKVNSLEDPDWQALSKKVQTWSNEVLKAVEAAGKEAEPELPELDGWPAGDSEEAPADEDEATEDAADDDSDDDAEDEAEEATESEEATEESVDQAEDSAQEDQSEETPEEDAPAARPKKGKAAKAPVKPQKSKEKSTGKGKEKDMPATKAVKSTKAPASQNARTRIDPNGTIKLLVKENPHREKTKNHVSFSKYKDGMTVAAAIKAKIPAKNIYYEVKIGNIKVIAPKKSAAA